MKLSKIFKTSLVFLMVLSGCASIEKEPIEQIPSNVEKPNEINNEDPSNAEKPNEINNEDPFAFLQSLDSLDEMRVVYEDESELMITDRRILDDFVNGFSEYELKLSDYNSEYESFYTIYFEGHTLENGFSYLKLDGLQFEQDVDYTHDKLPTKFSLILDEIFDAHCLENGAHHFTAIKDIKVNTLEEFFVDNSIEKFEPGTIDVSYYHAAPGIDDTIQPVYDFNQGLFIYHFYNREKMTKDIIEYDWTTQVAGLGACRYEEKKDHFYSCSDFEKAWILKMLNSFLVNYDGKYISYDEFMTQKEEFAQTLPKE